MLVHWQLLLRQLEVGGLLVCDWALRPLLCCWWEPGAVRRQRLVGEWQGSWQHHLIRPMRELLACKEGPILLCMTAVNVPTAIRLVQMQR